MIVSTLFECDVCGKKETGIGRELPVGWRTLIWNAGLLFPPANDQLSRIRRQHWCSVECAKAAKNEDGNPDEGG